VSFESSNIIQKRREEKIEKKEKKKKTKKGGVRVKSGRSIALKDRKLKLLSRVLLSSVNT
jgi:hypothetical protein